MGAPHALIIRDAQLHALAQARQRAQVAQIVGELRRRFPRALRRCGRAPEALVDEAAAWATGRGGADRGFVTVVAGLIAAFGSPPWGAPWAAALRDIRLTPGEAREALLPLAQAALDAAGDPSWSGCDGAVNPDQTLQAAIGSAQVTAILVTLSGALPGPLFTQLVRRSQLPVLFEGANTAGLLLNAQQPHLSVKVGSTTYATKPGLEASVTRLVELTGLLNKANPSAQEVTRLGDFLGAAAGGQSEVGAYFTDASDHVCHPRLDQLELALYRLDLQRRLARGDEQLVPPVEPAALDADALAV